MATRTQPAASVAGHTFDRSNLPLLLTLGLGVFAGALDLGVLSPALPAIGLFALIFLWTPPHFWALALMANTDYHKANVPMLPNVRGAERTKKEIFIYSIVLVAA